MFHSVPFPLADFQPWMIGAVVPIFIFMIPIVGILTRHQQKMAELMSKNTPNNAGESELAQMRQEMARLSSAVSALAINLDDVNNRLNLQADIESRVKISE